MEKINNFKVPELLAPAGTPKSLNAAVVAGADAVYLGLENFNARRGAENFSSKTLSEYVDYCHLRGVKVFLTLNTLVITKEIKEALKLVEVAAKAGVDAFIVQDLGIAFEINKALGKDFVHVSTQANIHSVSGVHAAHSIGVKRITLARELTLGEIVAITNEAHKLGIEIECFAHGAICVCYSGQCLLSSMIGARSANRGLCAQACRLPYKLLSTENKKEVNCPEVKGPYLLSPKDMCTIDNLGDFSKIGVDSLKIEGRMKSAEYVFAVTKVYREVLDSIKKGNSAVPTKKQRERLKASFSRGFTNGLILGERGNDMMSYDRPNNRGVFVGRVKSKKIFGEDEVELVIETQSDVCLGDLINIWTKRGQTPIKIEQIDLKDKSIKVLTSVDCKDVRVKDRVFKIRDSKSSFEESFLKPKVEINAKVKMRIGTPFEIYVECPSKEISAIVKGDVIEKARTKTITSAEVKEHFNRLGNTDFKLKAIDIDLDEGVGIGFSSIHHLRTEALEALKQKILKKNSNGYQFNYKKKIVFENLNNLAPSSKDDKENDAKICVIATNPSMGRVAKKNGALVYVPVKNLKKGFGERKGCLKSEPDQSSYPNDITLMMPLVNHDAQGSSRENKLNLNFEDKFEEGENFYCEDAASIFQAIATGSRLEIGQFFPVTNDASASLVNKVAPEVLWLSPELNFGQIKDITQKINSEVGIFAFGRQRLMTCEHCVLMTEGHCNENCSNCKRRKVPHWLKDRKDFEFPAVSDCFGRSTIYNSVDIDLSPNLCELIDAGVSRFMIDSTFLDEDCLFRILSRFKEALNSPPKKRLPSTTTGHLFRGV